MDGQVAGVELVVQSRQRLHVFGHRSLRFQSHEHRPNGSASQTGRAVRSRPLPRASARRRSARESARSLVYRAGRARDDEVEDLLPRRGEVPDSWLTPNTILPLLAWRRRSARCWRRSKAPPSTRPCCAGRTGSGTARASWSTRAVGERTGSRRDLGAVHAPQLRARSMVCGYAGVSVATRACSARTVARCAATSSRKPSGSSTRTRVSAKEARVARSRAASARAEETPRDAGNRPARARDRITPTDTTVFPQAAFGQGDLEATACQRRVVGLRVAKALANPAGDRNAHGIADQLPAEALTPPSATAGAVHSGSNP